MNSRKIYRIELAEADSIFTDCILMAATSNGGRYKPLKQIADHAEWLCQKYPSSGEMHTVHLIGNVLTIDKGTDNIVVITEVEILELDSPELSNNEAKDILAHESPTINRYGTGIADTENHEQLN